MTGFRPASRSEAKPLVGLYGESGTGKSWSALLLARGKIGQRVDAHGKLEKMQGHFFAARFISAK